MEACMLTIFDVVAVILTLSLILFTTTPLVFTLYYMDLLIFALLF
jgi:hypothetical protein